MAKLTAWLVTLIGVLLVWNLINPLFNKMPSVAATATVDWVSWAIALAVLIIGIGKLIRNYKKRRK